MSIVSLRGGIPGRLEVIHFTSHEQQLPISQSGYPHPLIGADRVRRLIGVQAQVLFAEPEKVLDRKPPKIHPTEIL